MAIIDSSGKIETDIYHKLIEVVPDLLSIENAGKSKVDGYMDLGFDVLHRSPERLLIALHHYYRHPSGDMLADPDMEIVIFPKMEKAMALTYQDCFGFRAVLRDSAIDRRCQRDLNSFLSQWLSNLIGQGHCIVSDAASNETLLVEHQDGHSAEYAQ
ncbi:MAG: hypothetical protein WBJ68_01400 [Candidatus Dechloromonas phosphoritropha]